MRIQGVFAVVFSGALILTAQAALANVIACRSQCTNNQQFCASHCGGDRKCAAGCAGAFNACIKQCDQSGKLNTPPRH